VRIRNKSISNGGSVPKKWHRGKGFVDNLPTKEDRETFTKMLL